MRFESSRGHMTDEELVGLLKSVPGVVRTDGPFELTSQRRGEKMRDPERIDRIVEKFRRLWHKYPDWRFGQLAENAVFGHHMDLKKDEAVSCCIFHQEDDVSEQKLDDWIASLEGLKELYSDDDVEESKQQS